MGWLAESLTAEFYMWVGQLDFTNLKGAQVKSKGGLSLLFIYFF